MISLRTAGKFEPLIPEILFPLDRALQVVLGGLEDPEDYVVNNKFRENM